MNEPQILEAPSHSNPQKTMLSGCAGSRICSLTLALPNRAHFGAARAWGSLAIALLLTGCGQFIGGPTVTGSGNVVTKQYPFTNFSGVSAGGTFHVLVAQGANCSVKVMTDDNLVDYLDVTTSGDRLRLFLKPNVSVRNATLNAEVTVPELTAFDLSGASRGKIEGCRSSKPLNIDLSGASRLEGGLESGDTRLELSGASHAVLSGTAGDLRVNVSGASHADLEQLKVKDATVDADGASHVTLSPTGKLQARASGASNVRYAGQPASVDSSTSGASSIKPK